MIVRVFMPHGAHVRYDGVTKVLAPHPKYIAFDYTAKDVNGNETKEKGHAVFNTEVICGYAKEGE